MEQKQKEKRGVRAKCNCKPVTAAHTVSHWPGPMLSHVAPHSSNRSAEARARVDHVTNMSSHVRACQTFSLANRETKTILNKKPNLTTLSNLVNEPSDVIILLESV